MIFQHDNARPYAENAINPYLETFECEVTTRLQNFSYFSLSDKHLCWSEAQELGEQHLQSYQIHELDQLVDTFEIWPVSNWGFGHYEKDGREKWWIVNYDLSTTCIAPIMQYHVQIPEFRGRSSVHPAFPSITVH